MPQKDYDPSLRSIPIGVKLYPVFTQIASFDLFTLQDLDIDVEDPEIAFLLSAFVLGRPYWGAYMKENIKNNSSTLVTDILSMVKMKLLCSSVLPTYIEELGKGAVAISVLGGCISLDVNRCCSLAEDLTSTFLAVCLGVSEDRRWVYTAGPSEPVVSEAACLLLHDKKNRLYALNELVKYVRVGYINGGDCGELVFQILHMNAWVTALKQPIHNQPIRQTVSDFFLCHFRSVISTQVSENKRKM